MSSYKVVHILHCRPHPDHLHHRHRPLLRTLAHRLVIPPAALLRHYPMRRGGTMEQIIIGFALT